jgi:hypothetical protein
MVIVAILKEERNETTLSLNEAFDHEAQQQKNSRVIN